VRCPSASTSFEKLTLEYNLFKFWKNLSIVFGVKRTECHPHTGKVCEAKYTHTAKVCEAKYTHTGKACGKVCVIHIPAKYVFMNWLIDNVSKIDAPLTYFAGIWMTFSVRLTPKTRWINSSKIYTKCIQA